MGHIYPLLWFNNKDDSSSFRILSVIEYLLCNRLSSVPVNSNPVGLSDYEKLFRSRFFAEVICYNKSILGWGGPNSMPDVLTRKKERLAGEYRARTQRQKGRYPCKTEMDIKVTL